MKKVVYVKDSEELIDVLTNVSPYTKIHVYGNWVVCRGLRIYADTEGVYNRVEVHLADAPHLPSDRDDAIISLLFDLNN